MYLINIRIEGHILVVRNWSWIVQSQFHQTDEEFASDALSSLVRNIWPLCHPSLLDGWRQTWSLCSQADIFLYAPPHQYLQKTLFHSLVLTFKTITYDTGMHFFHMCSKCYEGTGPSQAIVSSQEAFVGIGRLRALLS